jgi:hypothetical protein
VAQVIVCVACQSRPADFLVSNTQTGDQIPLCIECAPDGLRGLADGLDAQAQALAAAEQSGAGTQGSELVQTPEGIPGVVAGDAPQVSTEPEQVQPEPDKAEAAK